MEEIAAVLLNSIVTFISIYTVLLIIRILLTWFPNVNWNDQPFVALRQISDPYLNIFRSFIPAMGGFDFSSIVAIFALQLLTQALTAVDSSIFASNF